MTGAWDKEQDKTSGSRGEWAMTHSQCGEQTLTNGSCGEWGMIDGEYGGQALTYRLYLEGAMPQWSQ